MVNCIHQSASREHAGKSLTYVSTRGDEKGIGECRDTVFFQQGFVAGVKIRHVDLVGNQTALSGRGNNSLITIGRLFQYFTVQTPLSCKFEQDGLTGR